MTADSSSLHRSIDSRATELEWSNLFQWIEASTRLYMDANNNPNPWIHLVLKEGEDKLLPSTGFFSDSRAEEEV